SSRSASSTAGASCASSSSASARNVAAGWKETTMAEAEATIEQADVEAEPVEIEAPAPTEPAAEPAAGAEDAPPAEGKAKKPAKEPRKPRKGKPPADGEGAADEAPSIAAHPRATRSVARAKSWGALGGFLVGGYLSLPTHTLASAGLRALIAGTVCYVAAWAGAVFFWRRMVPLEISSRQEQLVKEAEALQARHLAAASH